MLFWCAPAAGKHSHGTCGCLAHTNLSACVGGGGQDGDKCFHSHHIYMTIAFAFQTLLWGLGLFISVRSIGFGSLIKITEISTCGPIISVV